MEIDCDQAAVFFLLQNGQSTAPLSNSVYVKFVCSDWLLEFWFVPVDYAAWK